MIKIIHGRVKIIFRSFVYLTIWGAILIAAGCNPPLDDIGKYPAPPPTEKLATLMAQGISTARPGYPAPIPGPLRGPNPTLADPTAQPTDSLPEAVQASEYFLAGHLGITQSGIELLSWENVTWNSVGLGCSMDENPSTPSPIPGYRVIISAGIEVYELRSDASGDQICVTESLQPGERVSLSELYSSQTDSEVARNHLALRLGLSMDNIAIQQVQPVEWNDDSLGCPLAPGNSTTQRSPQIIPGHLILLTAEQTQFEYHSGGIWLVYCGMHSTS